MRLSEFLPLLAVAPLCALGPSCASFDPDLRATTEYLQRLEPLLVENGLLAERVLVSAADIYNEKAKPEKEA